MEPLIQHIALTFGFLVKRDNNAYHIIQIRPLYRLENGQPVGLFHPHIQTQLKSILSELERRNETQLIAVLQTILQKAEISLNQAPLFSGMRYTNNSCYQDVILVSLFSSPNNFIKEQILDKKVSGTVLNVQNELKRIANALQKGDAINCEELKSALRECPKSFEEFHGIGMQDAGEFLLYVFELFKVEGIIKHRTTVVTNDLNSNPTDCITVFDKNESSAPVQYGLDTILTEDAILSPENLYTNPDTKKQYRRRIETTEILSAPYLIFYKHIHPAFNLLESIQIRTDTLNLFSVVLFHNFHYTAFIYNSNSWYFYDDSSPNLEKVGDFEAMLNHPLNARLNGVLYFYTI